MAQHCRFALMTLAALPLSACVGVPFQDTTAVAGGNSLYSTADLSGLRVTPVEIIEDSRCPKTVQCILAGTVRIRTIIEGGLWRTERILELGQPEPIADGAITLVSVSPDRNDERNIRDKDYRFRYHFEGGL